MTPSFPLNFLVICPGVHPPELTQSLLAEMEAAFPALSPQALNLQVLVSPHHHLWAFSPFLTLQFLQQQIKQPRQANLVFLAFSAGAVAAMGAAQAWHYHRGGTVRAVIAVDGWGVPLAADFPVYRLSHDYFTHWSSALLGTGSSSFYADPPVSHYQLWRSPTQATGWQIEQNWRSGQKRPSTAAAFLAGLLQLHST
ncbi:MAG: hypothetical protein HC886_02500 [Leptolyngbyaceae cyanobacterium SM1_1_3]|nr:hypothetical protein [Leptolyngbyaceae cyanobacterium SM1_1_3]